MVEDVHGGTSCAKYSVEDMALGNKSIGFMRLGVLGNHMAMDHRQQSASRSQALAFDLAEDVV